MPQVYIPLNTDGTDGGSAGALPMQAYLVQGDFGTSTTSIGSLGASDGTFADANQSGQPYAYSLDTRARTAALISDGSNHLKRVEIIRPGGNSVVFDFAWNSSTGTFSSIGTPIDYNRMVKKLDRDFNLLP